MGKMTMSEVLKQPSTRHPVFGENTLPQPSMKSYSAVSSMCRKNFGDRPFASWHSAVFPVCGEDNWNSTRGGIPRAGRKLFQECGSFSRCTKVPVSATVALHSKVLCSLHGRLGSDVPPPYRLINIAAGWQHRRVGVAFVRAASPVCGEDPVRGRQTSFLGHGILRVRGRRVLRAGFLNEPYGILRVRGRPFQECDSFSRYKGSRFNDCRLA